MSAQEIGKLLEKASDHDPHRLHTEMWPALEALAEAADFEVPAPLVTKTISVDVDARFPTHGEFERELANRIHELLCNEYMEGDGKDLMGYDGPFILRIQTRIEE
jgi:hypothetical protein